ncbi:MAG: oxidoreductase domain protein [Pedosphaera sp.]|nr:oxidoreductase domain protein [Pedosphaera sp.]
MAQIYKGKNASVMKTCYAGTFPHPYVGQWWPPGHIIGYEHTFVHSIADFLNACFVPIVAVCKYPVSRAALDLAQRDPGPVQPTFEAKTA